MYRIFVNGIELDIPESINIVMNYNVYDIKTPSNKGLSYSNAIKLSYTKINVDALNIYAADVFRRVYDVDIYEGTVFMTRGNIKIKSLKDYITIQITSKLVQLFEDMNAPLYELDLSDNDFIYNIASYNTLKNVTSGIWSWELLDNRFLQSVGLIKDPDIDPNISFFRPSYNVLQLLTSIFASYGYGIDTSGVDSNLTNLRMMSNAEEFFIASLQLTTVNTTSLAGAKFDLDFADLDFYWAVDFINIEVSAEELNFFNGSPLNKIKLAIEVDIDEVANLTIQDRENVTSSSPLNKIETHLIPRTATFITEDIERLDARTRRLSFVFDEDVTINSIRIIVLVSESDIYQYPDIYFWDDGSKVEDWTRQIGGTHTPLLEGLYVKTQYNLPSWTQADFVKEVSRLFNIVLTLEGNTVILKNKALRTAVNITSLIAERGKLLDNDSYASVNYFQYDSDESRFPLKYDAKESEKTFIKLMSDVSADNEVTELANDFNLGSARIYDISADKEEDRKVILNRFFLSTTNDFPADINADKKLLFSGISMDRVYTRYYSNIYASLQDSKIVVHKIKLSYTKLLDILRAGVVYDSYLGRELTVLQISKFNPNTLSEIKLATREINELISQVPQYIISNEIPI